MNYINFRQFEIDTVQSEIKTEHEWQKLIKKSDVCSGIAYKDVHLPWCMGFSEAKLMCEKYRGQMTTIRSSKQQKQIFDQLREIPNSVVGCAWPGIWTGFTDMAVEGQFIDVNDGILLNSLGNFSPFIIGQPNGDTKQNCAQACIACDKPLLDAKSWGDGPCDDAIHSFCQINRNPQFQLRGKLKE